MSKHKLNPKSIVPQCRSNRPEVFLVKCVLKICNKMTVEHSCFAKLLKSHLGMGVLPYISRIFSGQLLLRIPQDGCLLQ